MVASWFPGGSQLVPRWFSAGSQLVLRRFSGGSQVVLRWFSGGSQLVLNWFPAGFLPVLVKFQHAEGWVGQGSGQDVRDLVRMSYLLPSGGLQCTSTWEETLTSLEGFWALDRDPDLKSSDFLDERSLVWCGPTRRTQILFSNQKDQDVFLLLP